MGDFYHHFSSCGHGGMDSGEDFQEEEVWAMMKPTDSSSSYSNSETRNFNLSGSSSSSSLSAWRSTAASMGIPRSTSTGEFSVTAPQHRSSAPVDIPEILKKKKKKQRTTKRNLWDDANSGDDDESCVKGDDEMVPPHEYLARRLASTQIASFSMCEGVGRTLKGRDLSNLRNAILTKTGFLEP